MTIGQRIKQRREQLGLTQEELAKRVGYASRSSINKIELSRDLPLNKVAKMATALDTSPSFLMGWVDNPDPAYLETKTGKLEMLISKDAQDAEAEIQRQVNRGLAQAGLNMDEVTKAMDLFHQYEQASSEVQSAVELLLKAAQSES
jgi:transcriptional regulator with XRE-family HTH domain